MNPFTVILRWIENNDDSFAGIMAFLMFASVIGMIVELFLRQNPIAIPWISSTIGFILIIITCYGAHRVNKSRGR